MKAFKLTMMAAMLAFAGTAMAQGKVTITAADLTIETGKTANLEIMLDYDTEEILAGYNFSLYLPEGVTPGRSTLEASVTIPANATDVYPVITYMEYDEEADEEVKKTAAPKSLLKITEKTDGGILFVWIDDTYGKTPLANKKGLLMRVNIKADGVVDGKGYIKNVGFSNTDNVSVDLGNLEGSEFVINPSSTDGINEIQTINTDAPAYNLQGIRVNNAKGLIIRDGKKMVVK